MRCKIISLCIISLSIVKSDILSLAIISIIISALIVNSGIKPGLIVKDLKYFFVLLLFVFIARVLTAKGNSSIVYLRLPIWNTPITKQGIITGTIICWRFLVIMLLGIIFTGTTKPSSVKGAIEWLLSPIPFIPEKRISIMISLFLRFMPFLVKQTKEISNAQKARCSDLQPNPIKKLIRLSVPILKKTFQAADRLATAMEARCYSEDRTDPEFTVSGQETKVYAAVLALSIILLFF